MTNKLMILQLIGEIQNGMNVALESKDQSERDLELIVAGHKLAHINRLVENND
jgi:hypothetical protein